MVLPLKFVGAEGVRRSEFYSFEHDGQSGFEVGDERLFLHVMADAKAVAIKKNISQHGAGFYTAKKVSPIFQNVVFAPRLKLIWNVVAKSREGTGGKERGDVSSTRAETRDQVH